MYPRTENVSAAHVRRGARLGVAPTGRGCADGRLILADGGSASDWRAGARTWCGVVGGAYSFRVVRSEVLSSDQ